MHLHLQQTGRDVLAVIEIELDLSLLRMDGAARLMLETVVDDVTMPNTARRRSWLALAGLAEQEGDDARRARCFEAAARLP